MVKNLIHGGTINMSLCSSLHELFWFFSHLFLVYIKQQICTIKAIYVSMCMYYFSINGKTLKLLRILMLKKKTIKMNSFFLCASFQLKKVHEFAES